MNKTWKILIIKYKNGYTGMHHTSFLLLNRCGVDILKCKNEMTNPYSEATSKQSCNKTQTIPKTSTFIVIPCILYGTFKYFTT